MKIADQLNATLQPNNIFNTYWLETNGLGTWAASTVCGMNKSQNHGLFMTENQEGKLISLLAKLEESVITEKGKESLSVNQYPGALHPQGFKKLISFKKKLFPEFIYQIGEVTIRKVIAAVHQQPITLVIYELLQGADKVEMELLPMINNREVGQLTYQNEAIKTKAEFENNVFVHKAYPKNPSLYIHLEGSYTADPVWFNNLEYEEERIKGAFYREDLFSPGKFRIELKKNQVFGIMISDRSQANKKPLDLLQEESNRRSVLISHGVSDFERKLRLSADQFILKYRNKEATIKGGYFKTGQGTRETLISMPGLLLHTQRFDEAKALLKKISKRFRKGLLPNSLENPNRGYHEADTPLWFFNTAFEYFKFTEDTEFIFNEIMPVMKDTIAWFLKGSNNNICVDNDGLLIAGTTDQPATWMNACLDGWCITPRAGKAVEINALWYNALMVYAYFLDLKGHSKEVEAISELSLNIKEKFISQFWNKQGKFLYDLIDETHFKNDRLRPNQILALSLAFPVVSGKKAMHVLNKVEQALLTDLGLRTLSTDAMEYKPTYEGNERQRKLALHEGTVWTWLLGPYIDTLINLRGNAGKVQAALLFQNLYEHLLGACSGSLSALFNASGQQTPAADHAYAMSVAEVLRVGIKYNLFETSPQDMITEKPIKGILEDELEALDAESEERQDLPENEYHDEDLAQYNNPFSVISAFRSPGNKFGRLYTFYKFG